MTTNKNEDEINQQCQEDKEEQDKINASFQRLLDLELEEKLRDANCCIECKTRVEKWMSFCGAICEKKFNTLYEEIQTELPVKEDT
jgi:hypothetical protein